MASGTLLAKQRLLGCGCAALDQDEPHVLCNVHLQICTSEVIGWISTAVLRYWLDIDRSSSSAFSEISACFVYVSLVGATSSA